MARQRLALGLVAVRRGVENPQLQEVVAAARDEAPVARRARAGVAGDDAAGRCGGGPRHRVDAEPVGGEDAVLVAVVLELEDGDVAVGRGAREQAARLVRRPGDGVHRGLVQRKVEQLLPRALLLAPDQNLAVVARRCQDVAVFRVRPGYTPYCPLVTITPRD